MDASPGLRPFRCGADDVPEFRNLADLFAHLGVMVGAPLTIDELLSAVTVAGLDAIHGADACAVTLRRNGRFDTVAATSELATRVDAIQYELESGPCVDAVLHEAVFRSNNLCGETRWPHFARRAVEETAVRSMMSFRMFFEEGSLLAGLNIYATTPYVFDDLAETTGLLLSTHAALALAASQRQARINQLEHALEHALASNRDIGTAMGILMARHLATRQQAFDLLRVASQHTHRKLADVARDVIDTGELEYPSPRHD